MKTERVLISTLIPDAANLRRHPERNLEAISRSLNRFGQQKPIVVDKENIVWAGNGTLEAAKRLGWETIEIVRTNLNRLDATAFAIADNRTSELADWDLDGLDLTLKQLREEGIDLEDIGFAEGDVEDLLGKDQWETDKDDLEDDAHPDLYREQIVVVVKDMTVRAPLQNAIEELCRTRGWSSSVDIR